MENSSLTSACLLSSHLLGSLPSSTLLLLLLPLSTRLSGSPTHQLVGVDGSSSYLIGHVSNPLQLTFACTYVSQATIANNSSNVCCTQWGGWMWPGQPKFIVCSSTDNPPLLGGDLNLSPHHFKGFQTFLQPWQWVPQVC